tara:strand:- start:763 stop:2958 length:2196 start_codon:yes stop_codon:yes gene_type:complete
MTTEREQRIRDLHAEAWELEPEAREAFLRERCAGDGALFDSVMRMFESGAPGTDFLEPPLLLARAEDLIGMTLGDFTLTRLLGRGGMGVVFEADQAGVGHPAAVKVVHPHLVANPDVLARFHREIHLTAGLRHPGIVRVLAAGEDQGLHWYAMELVRGESLAALQALRAEGLPLPDGSPDLDDPRAIAQLGVALLDALQHAHQNEVLHRDVKPGNVLIGADGRMLLGDFGLARDLSPTAERMTLTGLVAGTLAYMSPEQARQLNSADDGRTDVYSAGAVLYELLTGSPPYGNEPTIGFLSSEESPEVPPVRTRAEHVDRGLALCLELALRRTQEQRYSTAQDFADDLRAWLVGGPVSAKPMTMRERFQVRMRSRRFVMRSAVAMVGVIVVVGALAWRTMDQVRARSSWAEVFVDASALSGDVRLSYTRFAPEPGKVLEVHGPSTLSKDGRTLHVPPGHIRLRAELTDGTVTEFDRIVEEKAEVTVNLVDPAVPPASLAWLSYEGGPETLTFPLEGADPMEFAVDVGPFQLSAAPITNGQVEEYLRQSNRELEIFGGEAHLAAQVTRTTGDWLDLPATTLSLAEATALAEWWGCRLPTSAEWTHALNHTKSEVSALPERPNLVPEGEPWIRLGTESRSSLHAYAKFVQPAMPLLEGTDLLFAGVVEWTSSPMLRLVGGTLVVASGDGITRGMPWHNTNASAPWLRLEIPRKAQMTDNSGDIGFRIAKARRFR